MRSRAFSLAAGLILLLPVAAAAQVRFGVMGGPGYTTWSGPLVEGGKLGIGLLSVSLESPMGERFGIRGEFGTAIDRADMGPTGLLEEPTTLSFGRLGPSAYGRYYFAPRSARPRFFAEAGAGFWLRTLCDVTTEGVGVLGGETVNCDDWTPTSDAADRPLDPTGSVASLTVGIGAYVGRFSALLRYEAVGSGRLDSGAGTLRAHPLVLVFEWTFGGGQRPTP